MTITLRCHSFVFIISFVIKITTICLNERIPFHKNKTIFYTTFLKSILSLHISNVFLYSSKILADFFSLCVINSYWPVSDFCSVTTMYLYITKTIITLETRVMYGYHKAVRYCLQSLSVRSLDTKNSRILWNICTCVWSVDETLILWNIFTCIWSVDETSKQH